MNDFAVSQPSKTRVMCIISWRELRRRNLVPAGFTHPLFKKFEITLESASCHQRNYNRIVDTVKIRRNMRVKKSVVHRPAKILMYTMQSLLRTVTMCQATKVPNGLEDGWQIEGNTNDDAFDDVISHCSLVQQGDEETSSPRNPVHKYPENWFSTIQ